jgi:LCP family protein required for cell wall assembly
VKRAIAVVLTALAAWVGVGALLADPPAEAQSPGPTMELGHALDGDFLPTFGGRRPVFVLAIGSDARPPVCEPVEGCLADSIHLIGINPKEKVASILGIPRDSYVSIPGVGTAKINDSLFYGGPDLVVQTVEELVGVDIDYYFLTAFQGFKRLVNSVGGIEVEIPYPMSDASSGASFEAGEQVLDGAQALAFSRNRKDTPNGDFSRSENQGRVLVGALAEFRKDMRKDPFSVVSWLVAGMEHMQTDVSTVEMFQLALAALQIDPDEVVNRVMPGGIGTAGGASVVTLGGDAQAVFDDIAEDGMLESVG